MRHPGTKPSRLRRVAGYAWFDWDSGSVDRRLLAEDVARGLTDETYADVPTWALTLPATLADATPTTLANLDAAARNALLDDLHRRAGRERTPTDADVTRPRR